MNVGTKTNLINVFSLYKQKPGIQRDQSINEAISDSRIQSCINNWLEQHAAEAKSSPIAQDLKDRISKHNSSVPSAAGWAFSGWVGLAIKYVVNFLKLVREKVTGHLEPSSIENFLISGQIKELEAYFTRYPKELKKHSNLIMMHLEIGSLQASPQAAPLLTKLSMNRLMSIFSAQDPSGNTALHNPENLKANLPMLLERLSTKDLKALLSIKGDNNQTPLMQISAETLEPLSNKHCLRLASILTEDDGETLELLQQERPSAYTYRTLLDHCSSYDTQTMVAAINADLQLSQDEKYAAIAHFIEFGNIKLQDVKSLMGKEEFLGLAPHLRFANFEGFEDILLAQELLKDCSQLNSLIIRNEKIIEGIRTLPQCQTLDCSGTTLTALPELPQCQTLDCKGCTRLMSLPELPQCQTLDCSGTTLTALPELPHCQTLDCSGTYLRALPALPHCQILNCKGCTWLRRLPELPHCQTLECSHCTVLTALPELPQCQKLNCKGCTRLTSLHELPHCQTLDCSGCRALTALPALPQCQTLDCSSCDNLIALPALPQCQILNCKGCTRLTNMPELPHCQTLDCSSCDNLMALPALPQCQKLDCSHCTALTALPELPQCHTLDCNHCNALTALPALPQCQKLDCSHCTALTALPELPQCQTLDCESCFRLRALPELPQCHTLSCQHCNRLTALPALPQCQILNCKGCTWLRRLPELPHCQTLECSHCTVLTALPELPQCQTLDCGNCTALTTLPALPQCQKLDCSHCTALTALPELPQCQTLDCESCFRLRALPELPQCQTLDCGWCRALTALPELPQCQTLDCRTCVNLTALPELPRCRHIDYSYCPLIQGIPQLPFGAHVVCESVDPGARFRSLRIDIEQFATNPKALLNDLGTILLNNHPFPSVSYFENGQPSQGIDAGGLRRDFVTRLCENLFKIDLTEADRGTFLSRTKSYLPMAQSDESAYQTLGVLFALCYGGTANFKTGPLFSLEGYKFITAFGVPGSDEWTTHNYFRSHFTNETIIEILLSEQGDLPELEPTDLQILAFIEDDECEDFEQFTQQYLVNNRKQIRNKLIEVAKTRLQADEEKNKTLIAFREIAETMKARLGEEVWGQLKAQGAEALQEHVEGVITGPKLKEKLIWEPSQNVTPVKFATIQGYLIHWIDHAPKEQLSLFVRYVTGTKTLSAANLKIEVYDRESDRLPAAHTCYYSLELTANCESQKQFDEKLARALSDGMAGTGFTFA